MGEKSDSVKVAKFYIKKAKALIGDDKPFPSMTHFSNRAFDDLLEKMEKREN